MAPPPDDESDIDGGFGSETEVAYDVSSDDRTWGVLVHAAAFAGFVVPLGNIIGPLVVWAIKKEESQFVDENGKQAVNFQITWTIFLVFSALSVFLLVGLVLLPIVALAWLALVIIAIVRASENQVYDYPLTLDLVS